MVHVQQIKILGHGFSLVKFSLLACSSPRKEKRNVEAYWISLLNISTVKLGCAMQPINVQSFTYFIFIPIQRVPHLDGFQYRGSNYRNFWLMYVQVGDFCVSRGLTTVPLTRISCNTVFSESQNARKAGTHCNQFQSDACTFYVQ